MKVWGVVGWKNTGKTGLVERLVAEFTMRGLTVSTVKHAHHDLDLDQPGTDSARHRDAGAREVMLASARRWALMHELQGQAEPNLEALLSRLSPVDLVLVEGYKGAPHPKVETLGAPTPEAPVATRDPMVRAYVGAAPVDGPALPSFAAEDTAAIADFIARELRL